MTDLLGTGIRDLVFWSGVGGVAIPLACRAIREIPRLGSPSKHQRPRNSNNDQLQAIEGVGPRIAKLLQDGGLDSFSLIGNASPGDIQDILDVAGEPYKLANPATWPEQARLLAAGDIEGFLKLVITLTAGVTVLENIDGIGEATGERLRVGGINTVAKLADASEKEIEALLATSSFQPSRRAIASWIAQARRFDEGDSGALAELAGNLQRATLPAAAARALAGPAETPSVPNDEGNGRWLSRIREEAALACTTTLGGVVALVSFMLPTPILTADDLRFERECILTGRTTFPASALFEKGKTDLNSEGIEVVKTYVLDRKRDAELRKDKPDRIVVIGYASDEGSNQFNQELSYQRARVFSDRLQAEIGWDASLFTYAGRGESQAKACASRPATSREACRVSDRKIEVLVAYGTINSGSATRTCSEWKEVRKTPLSGAP